MSWGWLGRTVGGWPVVALVVVLCGGLVMPVGAPVAVAAAADGAVSRVAGPDRVGTAVALAAGWDRTDTVVVARDDLYPDALAGSALAASEGAPLLLTPSAGLAEEVAGEVARLGASRAVLLGGRQALSEQVEADLQQAGVTQVVRVAGADRFDTAGRVALAVGGSRVLLVEGAHADPGRGWPDAVSSSAVSAFMGWPLLLTVNDRLPDSTRAVLAELDPAVVTVVGGPTAVDDHVLEQVRVLLPGAQVDRVAGPDRYTTSAAVSRLGSANGMDPATTWLATGRNWPDALAAGPRVARSGGVLLLTDGAADVPQATLSGWLDRQLVTRLVLVGGSSVMSEQLADALASRFVHFDVTTVLDTARQATVEVGPAGGTVEVTAADGTRVRLDVPAGAVALPTTITLTPYQRLDGLPDGMRLAAGVDLAPDGLQLTAPATLELVSAQPAARPWTFGISDGGFFYRQPATADGASTTLLLTHFSGAGVIDDEGNVDPEAGLLPSATGSAGQSLQEFAAMWRIGNVIAGAESGTLTTEQLDEIAEILTGWFDSIAARAKTAVTDLSDSQILAVGEGLVAELLRWWVAVDEHGLSTELHPLLSDRAEIVGPLLRDVYDAIRRRCDDHRVWDGVAHDTSRLIDLVGIWDLLALPDQIPLGDGTIKAPSLDELATDPCATIAKLTATFDPPELDTSTTHTLTVTATLQTHDPDTGTTHVIEGEPMWVLLESVTGGTATPTAGDANEANDSVIGGPGAINEFTATITPAADVDQVSVDVRVGAIPPGRIDDLYTATTTATMNRVPQVAGDWIGTVRYYHMEDGGCVWGCSDEDVGWLEIVANADGESYSAETFILDTECSDCPKWRSHGGYFTVFVDGDSITGCIWGPDCPYGERFEATLSEDGRRIVGTSTEGDDYCGTNGPCWVEFDVTPGNADSYA